MPALVRPHPQKIKLGEMRDVGFRRLLVYCGDYNRAHHVQISADPWPDYVWLCDLEASSFVMPAAREVPISGCCLIGNG
jgi:hypothetical protein